MSSAVCGEADCERSCWSVQKHGRTVIVSNFCREHSWVPMFDVPAERKPRGKANPAAVFRAEVARRRGREGSVFGP
jgi:hypothetical protein